MSKTLISAAEVEPAAKTLVSAAKAEPVESTPTARPGPALAGPSAARERRERPQVRPCSPPGADREPVETPTSTPTSLIVLGVIAVAALIGVAVFSVRPRLRRPVRRPGRRSARHDDLGSDDGGDQSPCPPRRPAATTWADRVHVRCLASATAPTTSSSSTVVAPEDDEKKPLSWRIIQALNRGKAARAYDLAVQYTSSSPNSAKAWQMRGWHDARCSSARTRRPRSGSARTLAPPGSDLAAECRSLSQ